VPFGTVGLTLAGKVSDKGGMPLPALLIDGFRTGPQRTALLRLGFVHAAMVLALVLVASAFAIDELRNWKVSDGHLDPASVSQNIPWDALTVTALLYTPVLMLTWFRAATGRVAPPDDRQGGCSSRSSPAGATGGRSWCWAWS